MIAPDFARMRVLATGSIAPPMVEGACARIRAKDKRGRGQRGLYNTVKVRSAKQTPKQQEKLRKNKKKFENPISGLVQYAG